MYTEMHFDFHLPILATKSMSWVAWYNADAPPALREWREYAIGQLPMADAAALSNAVTD